MRQLEEFSNKCASKEWANHATGVGPKDGDEHDALPPKNVEVSLCNKGCRRK